MARKKVYAREVTVEEAPRFVKRKRKDKGYRARAAARTVAGRQAAKESQEATKEAQPFQEPPVDYTQDIQAAQAGLMKPGAIEITPKKPSKLVALGALGVLAYIGWEFLKSDDRE